LSDILFGVGTAAVVRAVVIATQLFRSIVNACRKVLYDISPSLTWHGLRFITIYAMA
jgi:hypothetical protein